MFYQQLLAISDKENSQKAKKQKLKWFHQQTIRINVSSR